MVVGERHCFYLTFEATKYFYPLCYLKLTVLSAVPFCQLFGEKSPTPLRS